MDFVFNLSESETNTVLQGLGELPAKSSLSIIMKLQKQANEQIEASKHIPTP